MLILAGGASILISLLINSIIEHKDDKTKFLKKIISNEILCKDKDFINKFADSLLKYQNITVLIENDHYFFLEIVNKIKNERVYVKDYVICLKCLYYSEGTKFKRFLKNSYIKGINLYLKEFVNYIENKPLMKMNFLCIFLYIPIKKIPFSVYVIVYIYLRRNNNLYFFLIIILSLAKAN